MRGEGGGLGLGRDISGEGGGRECQRWRGGQGGVFVRGERYYRWMTDIYDGLLWVVRGIKCVCVCFFNKKT